MLEILRRVRAGGGGLREGEVTRRQRGLGGAVVGDEQEDDGLAGGPRGVGRVGAAVLGVDLDLLVRGQSA